MRKNILLALLAGILVCGMTACSRGDENKASDATEPNTASVTETMSPTTDTAQVATGQTQAPAAEQTVQPVDSTQAPVGPSADNTSTAPASTDAQGTTQSAMQMGANMQSTDNVQNIVQNAPATPSDAAQPTQ